MSRRWYNETGNNSDIILVSRIRLLRNFAGFLFPDRASEQETMTLLNLVETKLKDLHMPLGEDIAEVPFSVLESSEKRALEERHLINKAALISNRNFKLYTSESEAFSLTVNVEDHVRLLLSKRGQCLHEIWERIDAVDDFIDSKIPYAFDREKGFKTTRISNMGTGMRCYYVMHLPLLNEQKNFNEILNEMSKYGVIIKSALDMRTPRAGGLFVLYNQRTLGLSENGIIDVLTGVADRLMREEKRTRENTDPMVLKDRVMRSYGILKYARLLELTEACRLLSDIMLGESLGIFKTAEGFSTYELILGIFPGNLQVYYKSLYNQNEIKEKRALFVQHFLESLQITG